MHILVVNLIFLIPGIPGNKEHLIYAHYNKYTEVKIALTATRHTELEKHYLDYVTSPSCSRTYANIFLGIANWRK